jgi:hypothetical protein
MRSRGFHHTEETIRKMVSNHGRWNAGLTKETSNSLQKQSDSLKAHWKLCDHPKGMLGKKHSDKTKLQMSLMRRGEKNGRWLGGITEGVRLFRKSKRYQRWRREVLKRSSYLCACGSKANVAHHILSVKNHPEFRFNLGNGLAMCSTCHNKLHKKRGW